MRLLYSPDRALRPLALAGALLVPIPAAAGLANIETHANDTQSFGANTSFYTEYRDIGAVTPAPGEPPGTSVATARLFGNMASMGFQTSGSITSEFLQSQSIATAQADFVDTLTVNAEGIAPGTDLIVEVAWNIDGETSYNATSFVATRSKILLQGLEGEQWTRDSSNIVPLILDELGTVVFRYAVKANQPIVGNIFLRCVAGMQCGGPGSLLFGDYSANANATLAVNFLGVTHVMTATGQELYRWDTAANSGLTYGFRDDDPPLSMPTLTVGPSPTGTGLVRFSWESLTTESYAVEATKDGTNWVPLTEVRGTGTLVDLDLLADPTIQDYRLITLLGTGRPSRTLATPDLIVKRAPGAPAMVRLMWKSNHWERYRVLFSDDFVNWSELLITPGDGGVRYLDFPTTAGSRIYRIAPLLK